MLGLGNLGEVPEWMKYELLHVSSEKRSLEVANTMAPSMRQYAVYWRGARVVEWTGFENQRTGDRTEGSNPSLSATYTT